MDFICIIIEDNTIYSVYLKFLNPLIDSLSPKVSSQVIQLSCLCFGNWQALKTIVYDFQSKTCTKCKTNDFLMLLFFHITFDETAGQLLGNG